MVILLHDTRADQNRCLFWRLRTKEFFTLGDHFLPDEKCGTSFDLSVPVNVQHPRQLYASLRPQ